MRVSPLKLPARPRLSRSAPPCLSVAPGRLRRPHRDGEVPAPHAADPEQCCVRGREGQGFFERIDFSYDLVGYGESAELFVAGTDPVGQESAWEAARFQSEGEDISYFGTPSALNFYSGVIIRAADADKYKTLSDLKGKKLGQPGLRYRDLAGVRDHREGELRSRGEDRLPAHRSGPRALRAPPAGRHRRDDRVHRPTATSLTNPDFKVITNFSEDWASKNGQPLAINGLMAHRSWLDQNTDVARDLVEGVNRGLESDESQP